MNSKSTFKRLERIFHFRHTTQPNRIAKQQTSSTEENKMNKKSEEGKRRNVLLSLCKLDAISMFADGWKVGLEMRPSSSSSDAGKINPPNKEAERETSSWNVTHCATKKLEESNIAQRRARVKCANCGGNQAANFQSRADWAHSAADQTYGSNPQYLFWFCWN